MDTHDKIARLRAELNAARALHAENARLEAARAELMRAYVAQGEASDALRRDAATQQAEIVRLTSEMEWLRAEYTQLIKGQEATNYALNRMIAALGYIERQARLAGHTEIAAAAQRGLGKEGRT